MSDYNLHVLFPALPPEQPAATRFIDTVDPDSDEHLTMSDDTITEVDENNRRSSINISRLSPMSLVNNDVSPTIASPDYSRNLRNVENRLINFSTIPSDASGQISALLHLQEGINFISAKQFSGPKVGMKYFWGPFGLGYYTNCDGYIERFHSNIKQFNKLTFDQRSIIYKFIKEIRSWPNNKFFTFLDIIGLTMDKTMYTIIDNITNLIETEICTICFDLNFPLQSKIKCISFECGGMCIRCKDELGNICLVCDTLQEIKCPICLETRPAWAAKILSCSHGICWKCYGGALEKGHALTNCPQCRKPI